MARYVYADLRNYLIVQGCCTEGDAFETGTGWYTADWMPFTVPSPIEGYVDADVIDAILADRWVRTGPVPLKRYPDPDETEPC
jgi:hypothetical protein